MRLVRTLIASSFVLLTSSMIAEEVAAEDAEFIAFQCDLPMVGSERCGSPERNVRVGGRKSLNVQLNSIPAEVCATFTVYHAVDRKEMARPVDVCGDKMAQNLWINGKDEAVDVYMMVKSNTTSRVTIKGHYIIAKP